MSCYIENIKDPGECGSGYKTYKLEMDDDWNLYRDGVIYAKVLRIEKRNNDAYITEIERISDNPFINGEVRTIIMYNLVNHES